MGCEDCLSRRQFLAKSAVAAAAVALAAGCGNGQIGPTAYQPPSTGSSSNGNTIKVGDFPSLATVGTLVKVNSFQAVKRTGAATFAAYSMVCTHQGCLTQLSSNMFFCPVTARSSILRGRSFAVRRRARSASTPRRTMQPRTP